jgi:hypothetical protein
MGREKTTHQKRGGRGDRERDLVNNERRVESDDTLTADA